MNKNEGGENQNQSWECSKKNRGFWGNCSHSFVVDIFGTIPKNLYHDHCHHDHIDDCNDTRSCTSGCGQDLKDSSANWTDSSCRLKMRNIDIVFRSQSQSDFSLKLKAATCREHTMGVSTFQDGLVMLNIHSS